MPFDGANMTPPGPRGDDGARDDSYARGKMRADVDNLTSGQNEIKSSLAEITKALTSFRQDMPNQIESKLSIAIAPLSARLERVESVTDTVKSLKSQLTLLVAFFTCIGAATGYYLNIKHFFGGG